MNGHDLVQRLLPNSTISGAALPNPEMQFRETAILIQQKHFGTSLFIRNKT
jgi:hypothetical protein